MRATPLGLCLVLLLVCRGHGLRKDHLEPLYGDTSRSSELKAKETALRKRMAAKGQDPSSASREMAEAGWEYLGYDDRERAMERFDRCWILDPGNYGCYWGYGVIMYRSARSDEALGYLHTAWELNRNSVPLNMDIAAVHIQRFQQDGPDARVSAFKADSIIDAQRAIDSTDRKYLCHGREMKEILRRWEEAEALARKCPEIGFARTAFRPYLPGDTSVPALYFHMGGSFGFPSLANLDLGVYLYDAAHFKINLGLFARPDRFLSNLYAGSVKYGRDELGIGILLPLSERARLLPGLYLARNYIDFIGAKIGVEAFLANPIYDSTPDHLFYLGFKAFFLNY